MKHNFKKIITITLTVAALTIQTSFGAAANAKKKNLLFIAVDDLKPILGCYGVTNITTPNIDKLAKNGVIFSNNHCQYAICSPTRVSLLTGMRPDYTQVWDFKVRMRDINPDILTIPQYFKNSGYTSIGMGKIFDGRGCDGWDTQDVPSWSEPLRMVGRNVIYLNNKDPEKKPSTEIADVDDYAYKDGQITLTAIKELKSLSKQDKPFFLAVGFLKPHLPFCAPKKYWDMYDRKDIKLPEYRKLPEGSPAYAFQDSWELKSGYTDVERGKPIPEAKQKELIHGYMACVTYIDKLVGELIEELKASGEYDNTVIVLWGDHGWHLGDHGMFCKHTNYEQATRSPLIFAGAGIKARGINCTSPTEFVDIFPTLCDLTDLKTPKQLQGTSLLPILDGKATSVKDYAVSQFSRNKDGKPLMGYTYRDNRYRYTAWIQKDFKNGEKNGPVVDEEFFDYKKDPLETKNFINDPVYAKEIERFRKAVN
ncbi:MAG: sulfatase [Kiritimatiellae bacterium]|nr:sulfatase [Kiritimatiellia bacterium]